MNKPKFETPDGNAANVEKIAALFPAAVSEGKVNFDILRTLLGDEIYGDEAYEFTWVGKREAIREAGRPIRKTLRPCPEGSKNWDTTENLYIEGDNLDVLKLLQESYLGKVKMIYIDPPYNTGNDFVYRDNFTAGREDYENEAGAYDEDGDRLFRNTETNGRFHSDWCSMIYPRLVLARNMLRDDGVIFISIDDCEVHNLRKISDEVFGAINFVGNIVWEGNGKNDSRFLSETHEYILIYAKSMQYLKENGVYWRAKKDGINEIIGAAKEFVAETDTLDDASEKLKLWFSELNKNHPSWKHRHYNKIDEKGVYFSGDISAESGRGREPYVILHPITGNPCKMPIRGFPTKKTMEEWIQGGYIDFGPDETSVPKRKRYIFETDSYVIPSTIYKDSRAAYKNLVALFGAEVFDNPKDESVLGLLCEIIISDNDIILDFFSGSATTAHAVMQLNAEDGGKRKFIMVQLPEVCAEGTEAAKAGYANICEIGKERIRRAGEKIKTDNAGKEGIENLDIGFRVLKLDDSNMKDVYYAAGEYNQNLLDLMTSNIKDDRTDMDLLYGCLLDWGLPLSLPHTHEEIDGVTIHTYNSGDLIACFADTISDAVVKEIAKRQPLRAVFRDSSFADSPSKINVEEIFKLLAPDTSVRVL
jgi:adenine-specific DNA-methyltransferase